jgi:hypothetical protein
MGASKPRGVHTQKKEAKKLTEEAGLFGKCWGIKQAACSIKAQELLKFGKIRGKKAGQPKPQAAKEQTRHAQSMRRTARRNEKNRSANAGAILPTSGERFRKGLAGSLADEKETNLDRKIEKTWFWRHFESGKKTKMARK